MEHNNNYNQLDIYNEQRENAEYGSMRRAGLFFFLLMLFEIPLAVVINMVQLRFPSEKETLISVLMTQGYFLIAALIYILKTGKSFKNNLHIRSYKLSSFFLSILVLICAEPMANCLNIFSQFFTNNATSQAIFEITENVPIWLAVVIVGCLPGFIEETIYRGIMYYAFRRYSIFAGVVISALSFGLMHLNFNQMLYAVYFGVIFALLVEATGSLVSTMIIHMLFNAISTGYIYILPKMLVTLQRLGVKEADVTMDELLNKTPTNAELIETLKLYIPMAVIGILLAILLIRKIADINGRTLTWNFVCKKNEKTLKQNEKPINVWIVLGWLFCLVISIVNM